MNWRSFVLRAGLGCTLALLSSQCSHVRYQEHVAREGYETLGPTVLTGTQVSLATQRCFRQLGMSPKAIARRPEMAFERARAAVADVPEA